jgi:hypothetical protein
MRPSTSGLRLRGFPDAPRVFPLGAWYASTSRTLPFPALAGHGLFCDGSMNFSENFQG